MTPTDGINFEVEIAKVRGGGILWAMINNFDLKLFCLDPANEAKPQCKWMKNVKYYAFSSHDNVISALMATLGAKTSLVPIGYPSYSSCLSLELWNTSSGPSIRLCQDTWSPNTNMWEEQPTPPPPNDRTTSDAVTLHTSLLSHNPKVYITYVEHHNSNLSGFRYASKGQTTVYVGNNYVHVSQYDVAIMHCCAIAILRERIKVDNGGPLEQLAYVKHWFVRCQI
ncbi:unnamed protein product [Toxocara canis]|uniref:Uncharacterized protein n=1 Tax=Toxocara canis TaxID=6265 RepID=A0A3P7HB95_TOXCA|nr:unnamed protein product [Toxocara canis]